MKRENHTPYQIKFALVGYVHGMLLTAVIKEKIEFVGSIRQTTTAMISEQALGLPSPEVGSTEIFPQCLNQLKVVGDSLGGTYGVNKLEDKTGRAWVQKKYFSHATDHPQAEYSANKVYKICGALVPEVMKYDKITGLAFKTTESIQEVTILTEYIKGISLKRYLRSATEEQKSKIYYEIQQHFVVDCLLGNYDIIGETFDNILVTNEGNPYRIDNGASFDFRAQGSVKTAEGMDGFKKWGPKVSEIEEMRSDYPTTDFEEIQNVREVYRGISDEEVIKQIEEIYAKKEAILAAVLPRHREMVAARIENLNEQRERLTRKRE